MAEPRFLQRAFCLSALATLTLAGAVAACDGDDSASTSGGVDASTSPDATSGGEGGATDGGNADATPDDSSVSDASDASDAAVRGLGVVSVSDIIANAGAIHGAGADFVADRTTAVAALPKHIGMCEFVTPGGVITQPPRTSAGTISVMVGASTASLTFDGTKYTSASGSGTWPVANAAVTASADGGAAPAFSLAVTGPNPAILNVPSDGGLTIARNADFVFTWTGGTANQIVQINIAGPQGGIYCAFDSALGTATVPKSLLTQLPMTGYEMAASTTSIAAVDAGTYDIVLMATVANFRAGAKVP